MSAENLNFDIPRPTDVSSKNSQAGRSRAGGGGGGGGQPLQIASGNNPSEVLKEILGRFGRYQLMVFVLCACPKMATAMNMFGIIFWGPKFDHTCPSQTDKCPCVNPEYPDEYKETLIAQFNLVCDRAHFKTWAQAIFQFGVLLGSFLFGFISDRWGRRLALLIASIVQMLFSITAAAATHIMIFLLHRFLIGLSTGGVIVIGFVLMNEFLHPKDRDVVAPLFFLSFNFCAAFVPLVGYLIRNWRWFQVASGCSSFVMLPMFCLLPDSPRWLIAEGRSEQAIKILERLRRWNKMPTEMVRPSVMKIQGVIEQGMTVRARHLLINSILRRYFLVMCFTWLVSSMVFYGVSQFVGHYAGDLYLNSGFNQLMNFVGCTLGVPITYFTKRKAQMFVLAVISGSFMLMTKVVPQGTFIQVVFATVTSVTGFLLFNLCFIYGSELYPTVIRSRAMGLNSLFARMGSTFAPMIVDFIPDNWVPVAFALPLLTAACLSCLLDESKGTELPNTIDDLEQRILNNKMKKREKVIPGNK